jgi:F-type H+-transporting ATPase subunit a
LFFFSNIIELVPGLGTIGVYGLHNGHVTLIPFVRSASADLNFTLAIAVIAMASTWVMGIREIGIRAHLSKFFTIKNPIAAFVGLLEFVSEFAKVISRFCRLMSPDCHSCFLNCL